MSIFDRLRQHKATAPIDGEHEINNPEKTEAVSLASLPSSLPPIPEPKPVYVIKPKPIKSIFCAHCQITNEHECRRGNNREVICQCSKCGREIKFPLTTLEEFQYYSTLHHAENAGQITVEVAAAAEVEHDRLFRELMGVKG